MYRLSGSRIYVVDDNPQFDGALVVSVALDQKRERSMPPVVNTKLCSGSLQMPGAMATKHAMQMAFQYPTYKILILMNAPES